MATVTSSTRKLNPTSNTYETNSGLTVGTNIVVGGTVDGRDIASDGSKLDGIAVGANNYSLPAGSSSTRGGFKIGYTQSGKNYPIVVSSEQMYVNVPWTDTNTTYSVGDGGLTQKNFTTTLKSKLDGIAAGATNVTNNNQLTNGAGYVTTNTTYSVGDGGLTQNNFTDADHTKLNGIATGADVTPSWVPSSNPSYATQSYVGTQISNLVGGAPAALDTLNELAEAIGDDASYASSITSALAAKAPLASPTFTGTVTTPNLTIGSGNKIKFANNDYIRYDDANGVGRFHFDSDGGTNNSSVQAATFVGALSGNASTATKWATARTLSLTGEVTGSVSWDGSGNASLATTMNNGSLDDQYVTVGSRHQGNASALSEANKASIRIWDVSEATDDPSGSVDGLVLTAGWDSSSWAVQQYHDFHSNDLYLRSKQSGTWMTTWDRVFHDTYHPNADTLTTARTIAGTSFNGSANINISYNNLINKPTIPTNNNQLTNGAGYVTTDTNTTYSVGDGGLTQKNFTTTLKSKLDGIATSANNYSLPAASSSTRGGVKIGYTESGRYYPVELSSEKMFVHVPWVDTNTNTTYSVGDGGLTQKNFTTTLKSKLDGIATSANNYSLPAGSSSTRGGFKIGYTESGRYYPVEVSSEKMFVHVPWVDTNTNTTYSVGDGGLTQKNFTTTLKSKLDGIATSANNYSLPAGSSSTRGGFKIGYTESGKNYPVEVSSEKMYVNVPWSDSNTTYSVGDGGLTQKNFTSTLKTKLDGIATGATNVTNNNQLTNGAGYVTTNTTYSAGSGLSLSSTTFSHSDTSSQGSVNNSSGTVVQDVTLDTYGHITSLGSTNLDSRYYTESEVANHFKTLAVQGNFMNTYSWSGDTVGSANNGWSDLVSSPFSGNSSYDQNGTNAENSRSVESLPSGAKGVVWQTPSNDSASNDDGGWNCTINGVDSTKAYRSVIYFKRTDDSTSGTFYHGCHGSHTLNLNASANTNPYFNNIGYSNFVQDRWYVSIGYIQPYQSSGGTSSSKSGIYDCTTGKKVHAGGDFMMKSGSTTQQHRTYLYYSTDTSTSIEFYGPRFEELNSNEPSTQELVNKGLDGLGAMSFHSKYDPEALTQLTESSDANDDKFLLWDESASVWKYMRLDDLQDSIDNNTTYSVGDGGLTQKNFTTTLKNKLDGIAAGATNVTNNNQLTNGAGYVTSSGNTIIGTDSDITTSNAEVVNNIYMTDGVITSHTKRTLTLANLGYTGATNANYITNNNQLTNGAGYVTTNTTYSVGDGGLTQKNFTTTLKSKLDGIATSANNYSLPAGSSSTRGGFKIGYTESGKNYPVEVSSEKMYVNVPWVDTNTNTTYSVGDGGLTQKNFTTTLKTKLDGIATGATNVTNNNQLTNGAGYVTTNTTYSVGDGGLTQKNFTSTLKTKLDGIATSANNYVLPTTISGTRNFSGLISANAGLRLGDNDKIQLGDSQDLEINHYSVGQITNKTGDLYISSTAANTDIIFYAAIGATPTEFYRMNGGTGKNTFLRPVDISANLDVTGIATADAFRTDTSNTGYNLITRNSTSGTLYVQAAQSNSLQTIASFRYGSATVNQGTETFRIRRDNVNVFGANFTVGGSITGNSKNFSIPHPTKEGKRLVHSCLEGPEIGVYFRGRSQSSTIEMPDYWDGLVHLDSMTVELTAIGPNQDLYVADIADDGDVTVASNTETALNYFYVVYGERKDLERLEIEIDDTVEVEESSENSEEP